MTWIHALLLGILEGLTEFLPRRPPGAPPTSFGVALGDAADNRPKAIEIIMQLGAIIAVVLYYRVRLWALVRGILARDPASLRLLTALALGLSCRSSSSASPFHKRIEGNVLMAPIPVAGALIAGGVLMVVVEHVPPARPRRGPGRERPRQGHPPPRAPHRPRPVLLALARRLALDVHHRRRPALRPSTPRPPPTSPSSSPSRPRRRHPSTPWWKHRHEIADAPGGAVPRSPSAPSPRSPSPSW